MNEKYLNRYDFKIGKDGIKAWSTPYDKFLTNFEKNILPDLKKTAEVYAEDHNWEFNDKDNVEGLYYEATQKALNDAKSEKDYTETMRLLIRSANLTNESTEGMIYDNLATPEEAKRIFMEMWSKQFPEIKNMNERNLQQFIRNEFPKVGVLPEKAMIKSLKPNNMNEKGILENLKKVIPNFALFCEDILVHTTKEWDIKVLYAMKLLEEKLTKRVDEAEKVKKINDLKSKL